MNVDILYAEGWGGLEGRWFETMNTQWCIIEPLSADCMPYFVIVPFEKYKIDLHVYMYLYLNDQ